MSRLPDYEIGFMHGNCGSPPAPEKSAEFGRGHDDGYAHRKWRQEEDAKRLVKASEAPRNDEEILRSGVRLSDGAVYTAEWDRDGSTRQFLGGYHTFDIFCSHGSGFFRVGRVDTPGYSGTEVVRAVEAEIVTGAAAKRSADRLVQAMLRERDS